MRSIEDYERLLWEHYQLAGAPDIEKRFCHALSVKAKALELIFCFNLQVDQEKAAIAAVLHDYAKYETIERFQEIVFKYQLKKEILAENPKLLHALLGPYVIKEDLALDDEEILEAIRDHTLGSCKMSKLSEVIFLADFTCDTRSGDEFEEAKALSKIDFYGAILAKIRSKLKVYPDEFSIKLYQKYQEVKCKS